MSEARFSFTTKLGGDLLTVRGDSIEEFDKNVAELSYSIAEIAALQEAVRAVGVVTTAVPQAQVTQAPTAAAAAPAAVPGGVDVETDRWGNVWTYNLPDAPDLPDGRGKYAQKQGTSKAGKPYKAFFDPAKGPKPFPAGQVEAEPVWARR